MRVTVFKKQTGTKPQDSCKKSYVYIYIYTYIYICFKEASWILAVRTATLACASLDFSPAGARVSEPDGAEENGMLLDLADLASGSKTGGRSNTAQG